MALVRDKNPLCNIEEETDEVAVAIGLPGSDDPTISISARFKDYLQLLGDNPREVARRLRALLEAAK